MSSTMLKAKWRGNIYTLEIAIASSRPGGGVSSSSPNFNSPNFLNQKQAQQIKEKQIFYEEKE